MQETAKRYIVKAVKPGHFLSLLKVWVAVSQEEAHSHMAEDLIGLLNSRELKMSVDQVIEVSVDDDGKRVIGKPVEFAQLAGATK